MAEQGKWIITDCRSISVDEWKRSQGPPNKKRRLDPAIIIMSTKSASPTSSTTTTWPSSSLPSSSLPIIVDSYSIPLSLWESRHKTQLELKEEPVLESEEEPSRVSQLVDALDLCRPMINVAKSNSQPTFRRILEELSLVLL